VLECNGILSTLAFVMDILSSIRKSEAEAEKKLRELLRKFARSIERDLQKERPTLFRGLEDFANVQPGPKAWSQFKRRWPKFFPKAEYDLAEQDAPHSVRDYPRLLNQIWLGNSESLLPLLGIKAEPQIPGEPSQASDVHIIPAQFFADWDEGVLHYRGMCQFQRALYLLFRDSWRARVCEKCGTRFIARRVAQKYCTTDCSDAVQRDLKRRWWAEHGETWRQKRKVVKSKRKGEKNVTQKTR
jgi:hypothetical protein